MHVIVGSGIDVIEVDRVAKEMQRAPWSLEDGIFTAGEIDFCAHHKYPARAYAAFFAAKEATLKALGTGASSLRDLQRIEVIPRRNGKNHLRLHGTVRALFRATGARHASLSLAIARGSCSALVILED